MKNKILSTLAIILVIVLALTAIACHYVPPTITNPSTNGSTSSSTSSNSSIDSPEPPKSDPIDYMDTMFLVDYLFKNYSIFDVDYETAMLSSIRTYVSLTGDKYAMYYTPEELEEMQSENNGDLYGIGVQVIFDYDEYFMEIVLIMPDSPAQGQLAVGDKVTHIYDGENMVALTAIVEENRVKAKELYADYTDEEINNVACYETFQYAVSKLKGPENTYARFTVDRDGEIIEYNIRRAKVKTVSVTCKTSIRDPKVGIVQISQFDLTTPVQFKECMDTLIASGCDKFVFDVRNNPGGDLASVVAVLSTLLEKGDVIISTKDTNDRNTVTTVKEVNYGKEDDYSTCNVTSADIGKYRGYKYVVLANENSASAAELFTAALRDHGIAELVGVKTYGKGSMQSIYNLAAQGSSYYGALKLTTKLYFPPSGEGFNGIGLYPDHTVELEGAAAETHFYKLTEEIDNQLQKAVSTLID